MESHSQRTNHESGTNKPQSATKLVQTVTQVAATSAQTRDVSSKAKAVTATAVPQKSLQENRHNKESVPTKHKPGNQSMINKTLSDPQTSGSQKSRTGSLNKEFVTKERSPFAPMILIALTLMLMMGFQMFQALKENQGLQDRFEQQANTLREAKKVRTQLDSIAKQTYQLSVTGNENAAKIVEQMKKAGFTFNQGSQ